MKRTFIEMKEFRVRVDEIGDINLLEIIQNEILKDAQIGVLVKGTGGIRKFRFGVKGKGKSGGIRVFYLDIPSKEKCYLLFILEKSETENISTEGKKEFKKIACKIKSKELV